MSSTTSRLTTKIPTVKEISSHKQTVVYKDQEGRTYYYNEELGLPLDYFIDYQITKRDTITMVANGLGGAKNVFKNVQIPVGGYITLTRKTKKTKKQTKKEGEGEGEGEKKEENKEGEQNEPPATLNVAMEHIVMDSTTMKKMSVVVVYLADEESRKSWALFQLRKHPF
jgi:hypothetical protein